MENHNQAREILRTRGYIPSKDGGYALRSVRPAVLCAFVTHRTTPAVQILTEAAPGMRSPIALINAAHPDILDATLAAIEGRHG